MVRALTIVLVTVLAATIALWRVYETTGLVTFLGRVELQRLRAHRHWG